MSPSLQPVESPTDTVARDHYIDRIRVLMTALVVFHHSAVTYGGAGGWFYREAPTSDHPSSVLLTLFCATDQAYFMGLFFLLAGYYTPQSLVRKGTSRYLQDRFLRLGIPLLAFGFLLAPFTIWLVQSRTGSTLAQVAGRLWRDHRFVNGPLWFAQALLLFALVDCVWLLVTKNGPRRRQPGPVPDNLHWLIAALATGAAAVAIRQFSPVGEDHFGLQLGYFASYVLLFALGIRAWQRDWFSQLSWQQARQWLIVAAIVFPLLPAALAFSSKPNFMGGMTAPAILYAFWEPFVAWGIIATLIVWLRQHQNYPSATWDWLARRAYTVFVIHPPVLVAVSLVLRTVEAPLLLKFVVAGLLAVSACWILADLLLRLPGLRRIF